MTWLRRAGRALAAFHNDRRGAEGLEKILILAAVALPLLGLLIYFRDELAKWLKDIWGQEQIRSKNPLYDGDGTTSQ